MVKQDKEFVAVETTFNITNLQIIRDHLVKLNDPKTKQEIGFNMRLFYPDHYTDFSPHNCNTVCCIAGHIMIIVDEVRSVSDAAHWLGLNDREAEFLFYGDFSQENLYDITLESAIDCLNTMIFTGKLPKRR